MSDSPESKNSNSSPTAASSSISSTPSRGQSASTPTSQQQFRTENIGNWAARQEGYFAEQNRKDAAKREKAEQTRKKVLPIVYIIGGVIAAGLIIWGVVVLVISFTTKPEDNAPTIAGNTSEDVDNYRDILQDFFNKGGSIEDIENTVNDTLSTNNGQEYADQVRLAELIFLQGNGYYSEALEKSNGVNPDNLNLDQKIFFYGILYYCNEILGNTEAADENFRRQYELSREQGGNGGA